VEVDPRQGLHAVGTKSAAAILGLQSEQPAREEARLSTGSRCEYAGDVVDVESLADRVTHGAIGLKRFSRHRRVAVCGGGRIAVCVEEIVPLPGGQPVSSRPRTFLLDSTGSNASTRSAAPESSSARRTRDCAP
jgi:hypothetical protein